MTDPFYQDDWLTILIGDCRERLAELPAESVHCVVTSPPYWGLRDYGTATWLGGDAGCDHSSAMPSRDSDEDVQRRKKVYEAEGRSTGQHGGWEARAFRADGSRTCKCGAVRQDRQLGLEPTPEEFVANMVGVFREVKRVLRNDGTLWLNIGDSYANDTKWGGTTGGKHVAALHGEPIGRAKRNTGLKPKDLVGIPWMLAFALRADGWYLRSDIIWAKPNPMPESVTDRPTKSHEYLFLLTKSARYYYDADAVRESGQDWSKGGPGTGIKPTTHYHPDNGGNEGLSGIAARYKNGTQASGRNLRTVWTIATEPYPGAHFATFPQKLVEPCIKAGTSERGCCPECGAPWVREMEVKRGVRDDSTRDEAKAAARRGMAAVPEKGWESERTTTGWAPNCAHETDPIPCTVLDPFAGSGTTLMVAQKLSRRGIGIDLSADYLDQALLRNRQTPLGL